MLAAPRPFALLGYSFPWLLSKERRVTGGHRRGRQSSGARDPAVPGTAWPLGPRGHASPAAGFARSRLSPCRPAPLRVCATYARRGTATDRRKPGGHRRLRASSPRRSPRSGQRQRHASEPGLQVKPWKEQTAPGPGGSLRLLQAPLTRPRRRIRSRAVWEGTSSATPWTGQSLAAAALAEGARLIQTSAIGCAGRSRRHIGTS